MTSDQGFPPLRAAGIPGRWRLPVTEEVCVGPLGRQFLFGGAALGAAIIALEADCGRPLIWTTAQYLSFAPLGTILDLETIILAAGNSVSQARVTARAGKTEILSIGAALGTRPIDISWQGPAAPSAPPPERCRLVEIHAHADRDVHAALEIRVADGRFGLKSEVPVSGDGRVLVWIRSRRRPVDAVALAMMADFVPTASGNALERTAGGNSLDNTLRICRIVPTQWVLCEIRHNGFHAGFGHGRVRLFAEDGTLMAVASQSFIVRTFSRVAAQSAPEIHA